MIIDDARVDQILREMSDALAAMPDPGLEGAPTLRAQKAERRRIAQAQIDDISVTRASVAKFAKRVEKARDTRAVVVQAIADCERRAAAAATEVESRAWLDGPPYLRGESGFVERPGAVVAMERELHIDHLPTLTTCDEMLSQAESDLAPHLEHLTSSLDTWDASAVAVATATLRADLPNVEMHAEGSVR